MWRLPPRGNSGWRSSGAEPIPWRRTGRPQEKIPPQPPLPHLVPSSCLPRACDMRATKGRRQGRPPPPHTSAPPGVGDEGRGGRKADPPEDKAAGWGGSGERVRDGPHDRARREHAPYKPQRGDHRSCERRVGRATTGATRQAPPPAEGQVPRLVPTPCSRRAYAGGQTARTPPPPPPSPPPAQERGEDSEETPRGQGGGGRERTETPGGEKGGERRRRQAAGAQIKKNIANQRARAGTDSRDGRDTAGTRECGKGRGKGGQP